MKSIRFFFWLRSETVYSFNPTNILDPCFSMFPRTDFREGSIGAAWHGPLLLATEFVEGALHPVNLLTVWME